MTRPTVPFERIEAEEPALDDDTLDETIQPALLATGRARSATSTLLAGAFFAPLPAHLRIGVLARFERRSASAGMVVIRQGERGHPLVLVARGRLDVRADHADRPAVQIGTIALGEYIGEVALLARAPAAAHVVAATDVELLLLAPPDFHELASAYPALRAELADVAERRTREYALRLRGGVRRGSLEVIPDGGLGEGSPS